MIYQDFTLNLKKVINKGMSKGRYSTKVGEMYLCRYESLILLVQIVESSYSDCVIVRLLLNSLFNIKKIL